MIVLFAGVLIEEEDLTNLYDRLVTELRARGLTGADLDVALYDAACTVVRSRTAPATMPSLSKH